MSTADPTAATPQSGTTADHLAEDHDRQVVIAHLSDPHVDTSVERARRFARVMAQLAELNDIDAVVVTGDISDHGAAPEYEQFFTLFDVPQPSIVVPGNHDLRAAMSAHMTPDENGRLNSVIDVGGVRIVGLDSLVENAIEGRLDAQTIEFGHAAIAEATGPVFLSLHHPPVPVGHHVMDRYGLHEPAALAQLAAEPAVVAVLTGHIHTALSSTFAGKPLLGAPGIVSTMRLGSRVNPVADDAAMPGLAIHTLRPGCHLTSVFHYLSPEPSGTT
ncbi:metallophosphoesterase [Natronoglycomyces albus]|uniref:Metallophosphoesterase n=1 Tax=Natronoglycomyces albus TaxID=2811108 RepID=A0A895XQJ1_9ACTN|nr:metallophosphoesterase [Natronoglycomyces albus]QSB05639.1 metallophosphoesterase [Natronoglycomyces albus]